MTPDCPPNQTEAFEQCAKKTRKDLISVQCRHKMPVSSIVRKIIKDKLWQKMRAKVRRRTLKELVSRTDVPFDGQQPHLKVTRESVIAKVGGTVKCKSTTASYGPRTSCSPKCVRRASGCQDTISCRTLYAGIF